MVTGIRATVAFTRPDGCPLARLSVDADGPVSRARTSVARSGVDGSATEFLVEGGVPEDAAVEPVFSYGNADVVRIQHDDEGDPCPCEVLGDHGCPVHRYVADDGVITLVFHAVDMPELQAVTSDLVAHHPSADVTKLRRKPVDERPTDRVFVDRGKLTPRQLEVLRVAQERGYFERPRRANASALAAELGISQSTFTEHLTAAQRKLLDDLL